MQKQKKRGGWGGKEKAKSKTLFKYSHGEVGEIILSLFFSVCLCVCMHACVCVCVCVRERERERESAVSHLFTRVVLSDLYLSIICCAAELSKNTQSMSSSMAAYSTPFSGNPLSCCVGWLFECSKRRR